MADLLDLFPAGSDLADDGTVRIGGCRADDLADEFGTPLLVVAEDALRVRAREYARELSTRWPNSRVVFASKAFPCSAVQRVMVEEGLGLDVAGGGEILTALKAGVDAARVVLHGNAADDVDRLDATIPAGETRDALVRILPGITADTHSHVLTGHESSKFGLPEPAARPVVRRIEQSAKLRMRGLHVHIGSQIMDLEPFAESVGRVARLGTSRSTTWVADWAPDTPGRTGRPQLLTTSTRSHRRRPSTSRRTPRSSSSRAAVWSPPPLPRSTASSRSSRVRSPSSLSTAA